jgi:hypothetical protein
MKSTIIVKKKNETRALYNEELCEVLFNPSAVFVCVFNEGTELTKASRC